MGVLFAADTLQGPGVDWYALSPLLVLLGGAMVLLVVGALTPPWPKHWYALFTAGKTPPAVVARISNLTNQIMADPQVGKALSGAGFDPGGSTPEAVTKLMREEYDRWKKVVAEAKIVPE